MDVQKRPITKHWTFLMSRLTLTPKQEKQMKNNNKTEFLNFIETYKGSYTDFKNIRQ